MRLNGIDAELLDRDELMKFLPYLDYSKEARFPILGGLLQRRTEPRVMMQSPGDTHVPRTVTVLTSSSTVR